MSKATTDQLETFYELSSALTDFDKIDLIGTGVGREYFDELVAGAGEENVKDLLAAAMKAGNSTAQLRRVIWDDARFGPMTRNIVLMWYLGSWYPLSKSWHKENLTGVKRVDEHVVSAAAYQEALWPPSIGAHPRGAKPPGFGSWGEAAVIGGHDAEWVGEKRSGQKKKANEAEDQ